MPKEYTLIGGNGTRVSPLEVTQSGTYEAGDSRAFNPVKVNVPSGSSTLSGLTDVDISNPTDGQTLVYNAESGKWENGAGGGGGGGGGPLLVNFAYDETSDSYPGDKTAGEVLASCEQYGFATGICDGNTARPIIIRAIGSPDGIVCDLGGFAGVHFDEFDSFNPDLTQLVYYYQPNETITGYYHGEN